MNSEEVNAAIEEMASTQLAPEAGALSFDAKVVYVAIMQGAQASMIEALMMVALRNPGDEVLPGKAVLAGTRLAGDHLARLATTMLSAEEITAPADASELDDEEEQQ